MEVLFQYRSIVNGAVSKMEGIKREYTHWMPLEDRVELSRHIHETKRFAHGILTQIKGWENGHTPKWPIDPFTKTDADRPLVYRHYDHAPPHVKRFMDLVAVRCIAIRDRARTKRRTALGTYID
jgi:hypothetical protein